MNIILLGKPGSGKGTISNELEKQNFNILPTGQILRQEIKKQTNIGQELEQLFSQGQFAPDHITNQIVSDFLKQNKDKTIVMDGYPRNENQWDYIKDNIDLVVILNAPDQVVQERITHRLIHESSGRVYNTQTHPPKQPNLDDITQEPLTKRSDDTLEVFQKRLNTYYQLTHPIIEKAKNQNSIPYCEIDTSKNSIEHQLNTIQKVFNSIVNQNNNKNKTQLKP